MTKSAIKKYTERLGFFGMILHYIGRFMTKTEQQVIGKLTVRFGIIKNMRSSGWSLKKENSEIRIPEM